MLRGVARPRASSGLGAGAADLGCSHRLWAPTATCSWTGPTTPGPKHIQRPHGLMVAKEEGEGADRAWQRGPDQSRKGPTTCSRECSVSPSCCAIIATTFQRSSSAKRELNNLPEVSRLELGCVQPLNLCLELLQGPSKEVTWCLEARGPGCAS